MGSGREKMAEEKGEGQAVAIQPPAPPPALRSIPVDGPESRANCALYCRNCHEISSASGR